RVKVEKLKDGQEKLTVGGKTYDTTWTTYKVTAIVNAAVVKSEAKVWMAKDMPLGQVKMENTTNYGWSKVKATLELMESGSRKCSLRPLGAEPGMTARRTPNRGRNVQALFPGCEPGRPFFFAPAPICYLNFLSICSATNRWPSSVQ